MLIVILVKFLKNLVSEDEELKRNYVQLEKLVKQEESLMLHQVVANTSETLDRLDVMDQKAGDGFVVMKRMEEKTDMVLAEMRSKVCPTPSWTNLTEGNRTSWDHRRENNSRTPVNYTRISSTKARHRRLHQEILTLAHWVRNLAARRAYVPGMDFDSYPTNPLDIGSSRKWQIAPLNIFRPATTTGYEKRCRLLLFS
jgi:hypothetical protein